MRLYEFDGESSLISISDNTFHGAAAVIASIKPLLDEPVQNNCKEIIVVNASPPSQYRNKTIFWFMKEFSTSHFVTFKWIYSKSGHGKGVPGVIGASVEKAIQDIVACNPGAPIHNVEDLLRVNLSYMIPSTVLMQHTTEQVNQVKTLIPSDLTPAPDTMKIHAVSANPCGTLSLKLLSSQSDSKNFCVLKTNKATNLREKDKTVLF